jgi:DNA-binding MarR family transcriptional regulator
MSTAPEPTPRSNGTFADYLARLGMTPGEIDLGMLAEFPGPYLRIAYERSYQDFQRLLGQDALHPGYFTVLTVISRNPGINQSAIGRVAGRDKSWVTKTLRQMEDQGLIRRVRFEDDRRAYGSYVTPKGQALHARMEEKAQRHLVNLTHAIGREGCAQLVTLLRKVIIDLPEADAAPETRESAPQRRTRHR